MKDELINTFISASINLIGKKCWGIIAGAGTGSNIVIDFGGKKRRKGLLKNDKLSDVQKEYEGEFSLYITCTWRLETEHKIICGSNDPNRDGGPMLKGLKEIIDREVTSLDIITPSLDVSLNLSGGYKLKVFCDETNEEEAFDNYSFFMPDIIFTVIYKGGLVSEERS